MNKLGYAIWTTFFAIILNGCGLLNQNTTEESLLYERKENSTVTDTISYSISIGDNFFQTLPLFYFYEIGLEDSSFIDTIRGSLMDTIVLKGDNYIYLNNGREILLISDSGVSPLDSFYLEYPNDRFNSYLILQEVSSDSFLKYRYKVINKKRSDPIWHHQEGFWCRDIWYGSDWKINQVYICHEGGPIFKLRRIK